MNLLDSAKVRTSFFSSLLPTRNEKPLKPVFLILPTKSSFSYKIEWRWKDCLFIFSPLLVQLIASILGRYVFKLFEWVLRKVISGKLIWTLFAEYPFDLNQQRKFDQYKIDAQLWRHDWHFAYVGHLSLLLDVASSWESLSNAFVFFVIIVTKPWTMRWSEKYANVQDVALEIQTAPPDATPRYILWLSGVLIISKLIMQTDRFCREFEHLFH